MHTFFCLALFRSHSQRVHNVEITSIQRLVVSTLCAAGIVCHFLQILISAYLYEACTTGVRCIKRTADSSENIPDCTNDICVCPSGTYSATVFGVSGCLSKL